MTVATPPQANNGDVKHSHVDVLIIGAGPAGLMAATSLTACGIDNIRVIDKRNDKIFTGQADGLQSRTLEVFQSFGIADQIWKQSNHMWEMNFWNPVDGKMTRTATLIDTLKGISRWTQVVLNQGRIEHLLLEKIKQQSRHKVKVERAMLPSQLEIDTQAVTDHSADTYPVTVRVRHLSEEEATPTQNNKNTPNGIFRSSLSPDDTPSLLEASLAGTEEVIHAKYVIGCDGAHSWTRKQLGFEMQGEQTEFIWGVLDGIPITDFPDIRTRCAIHSENCGSIMVIPREDGLVRFYIQVSQLHGNTDRHSITSEMILKTAQTIIAPYKLDIAPKDLNWWTAYQIGQRTSTGFFKHDRVFIAGDACHTHSPEAGQGMNVSMMDTYNLAWKMASVIKGQASPSILATYQSERRRVAQDLINFDHKFSRLFSGRPNLKGSKNLDGISLEEFQTAFQVGNRFTSGTSVVYGPSLLIGAKGDPNEGGDGSRLAPPSKIGEQAICAQDCGEGALVIGKRFNTAQVVCLSDAEACQLADRMPSDGRWRIVIFTGDIAQQQQLERVRVFAVGFERLLERYTPQGQDIDSVIDFLVISSTPRRTARSEVYPRILHPDTSKWHRDGTGPNETLKITSEDYWKIYTDEPSYHHGDGQAYEKYGVSRETGALVVVRPDGYVANLFSLDERTGGAGAVAQFFEGFMNPKEDHHASYIQQTIAPRNVRGDSPAHIETNGSGRTQSRGDISAMGDAVLGVL